MSEEIERSRIDRMRDYVPFFTTMLMIAGIAFTYYTYFYDINKTPQLIIETNMTKLDETDRYYIIKLSISIKNNSKSKVEIVANQSKLYGLRCNLVDNAYKSDSNFSDRVLKITDSLSRGSEFRNIQLNKFLECSEKHLIGYYQPVHNASFFLPTETGSGDIVSAVPKTYDLAYLETQMHFAISEDNIIVKYVTDPAGDVNYRLYVIDQKDSTIKHELNLENETDKSLVEKNNILVTGLSCDLWLSNKNAIKNSNKNQKQSDTTSYLK